MSKYLIVKAYTNSEWDSVSFACIEITNPFLQNLKMLSKEASVLSQKCHYGFMHISVSGDNAEYFIDEDFDEELDNNDFIIKSKLNKDKFSHPETYIGHVEIRIDASTVTFVTWGKYAGEEFFTERIPLNKIKI